ncbi:tail protein X [Selenomonas bovis]|uniref:tail protein X n=1 Tax=Selenomonas bovis TaxID=416586 RepID=UPI0039C6443F
MPGGRYRNRSPSKWKHSSGKEGGWLMSDSYRTKSGDTWDLIAYNELGACKYTPLLMDANREYIDTAIFSAGTILNIPDITRSAVVKNLPPWKKATT